MTDWAQPRVDGLRRGTRLALAALVLFGAVALDAGQPAAERQEAVTTATSAPLSPAAQTALVKQYCESCHSESGKAGGLDLSKFDPSAHAANGAVVEKMIRKLRAGMMPPALSRRPPPEMIGAFVATLESEMDAAAKAAVIGAPRTFPRLTRVEYALAIKDMLDLDVDVTAFLPPDTISNSFDNIADVQSFSPTLTMGYLRAASQISRLAVGDRNVQPSPVTYMVPGAVGQGRHVEGTPYGTRGGTSVVHTFPADGDYIIEIVFHGGGTGEIYGSTTISSTDRGEQIEVSLNGERVQLFDINPWMNMETDNTSSLFLRTEPIHVGAGPQRVSAAFLERYAGPLDDLIAPIEYTYAAPRAGIAYGITALPHLRELTVIGPEKVTGISETPSRRRVFTCRPTNARNETACATTIVNALATKAYRGALDPVDITDLMRLYAEGRKSGDFDSGIRLALQGILANPKFLFRLENVPAGAPSRVADTQLASRLSFFLWGLGPDAALLEVARKGVLHEPQVLEREVRRMLRDPRSEALSTRFAAQWLRLQDVSKISPDPGLFANYDKTLSSAYVKETELFFDSLVRDDRSVLDLLTADYSFVNERVARQYGIADVFGDEFRRVELPPERRGILGQGSMLLQTSIAGRTSPVSRGKWIMEVLLGTPPPPPPPNVPDLEQTEGAKSGRILTTRERMEQHRANAVCASCHRVIDPPGLALENFDVTGRWRVKEQGVPIDAAGQLYDGTILDGPAGLRSALMKHSDVVLLTFTEHLMTYAVGRRLDYRDMPSIRSIVASAGLQGNKLSAFVLGVAKTQVFQTHTRRPPDTAAFHAPTAAIQQLAFVPTGAGEARR